MKVSCGLAQRPMKAATDAARDDVLMEGSIDDAALEAPACRFAPVEGTGRADERASCSAIAAGSYAGAARCPSPLTRDQDVGVESAVKRARLERQRGHGHRVLEQPAEIGVVAVASAWGGAQRGAEVLVCQERVEQPP
jgi:hypothetical protein